MAPPEPAWDPVGPALYHQAAHGHKPRVPSDRWPNTSPKGSAGPDPIQSMAVAWPRQVSRCPGCLGGPLPRVRPPNLPSSRGPFLPVGSLSLFPQATACTPCAPSSGRPPAVPGRRPTPHCQAGMAGLLALPLQTCSFLRVSVPTGSSAQSHVCTRLRKQLAVLECRGRGSLPPGGSSCRCPASGLPWTHLLCRPLHWPSSWQRLQPVLGTLCGGLSPESRQFCLFSKSSPGGTVLQALAFFPKVSSVTTAQGTRCCLAGAP